MAHPISDKLEVERAGSHDGSDGSSPGSNDLPAFDLDFDLEDGVDGDDLGALPKQVDSAAGPVRRSRRPPSTAERKATHNAVERARRESLNGRFMELATALPTMAHVKRPSKAIIVNKSLEYIYDSRARENLLAKENEQLRSEINELRARLNLPAMSTASAIPTSVASAPAPNSSVDGSFAAYAAAAHTHAHVQASLPKPIMPTRHESFSAGSNGGSPRSVASSTAELSPPMSFYTHTPAPITPIPGSGAPQSFFGYSPVPMAAQAASTAPAQAPSPTSSGSPPASTSHTPAPPAPVASTPQDLFSLWSNAAAHSHGDASHGLDLFNAQHIPAPPTSLEIFGQSHEAWRMPFNHQLGVPVGGMSFF